MNNTLPAVALIGLVASTPIAMVQDASAPADPMTCDPGSRPGMAAGSRRGPMSKRPPFPSGLQPDGRARNDQLAG